MPAIATIGFFDGVHKGHRYLFEQLRGFAGQYDERALIFTFLQHPIINGSIIRSDRFSNLKNIITNSRISIYIRRRTSVTKGCHLVTIG